MRILYFMYDWEFEIEIQLFIVFVGESGQNKAERIHIVVANFLGI